MRRFSIFAILTSMILILSACGPAAGTAQPGATAPTAAAAPNSAAGAITMNGAGATFPFPLYSRWFYDYAFVDPSVKFNYQSIGSGGGIKQITAKTVDFGASDAILNDDQYQGRPRHPDAADGGRRRGARVQRQGTQRHPGRHRAGRTDAGRHLPGQDQEVE